MANETENEFLADLKDETPFKTESDPFKDVKVHEEAEEEEQDEKPVPFHQDPKIQRYVQKEVAKAMKDLKPTEVEKFQKETDDTMTDVLTRIIGNDTPEKLQAIKEFRRELGSLEERGAQRAIQEFQQRDEQAREEDRRAQTELDDYFEEIEDTYNIDLSSNSPAARKIRSEFVDYVRKIAPKNEDGEVSAFPDLVSSFEVFQDMQRRTVPSASRAKGLASRGMARSTDASAAPQATDKSWKGVEKLFSKLSS